MRNLRPRTSARGGKIGPPPIDIAFTFFSGSAFALRLSLRTGNTTYFWNLQVESLMNGPSLSRQIELLLKI